jgi:hypothetical protein
VSDRTCSKCAQAKAAAEFWFKNTCKACHNVYMRRYRAANPKKISAIQRRNYERNREKRIADAVAYARVNPPDLERRRRNARARYAADRERASGVKKAWQEANVELVRELRRRSASRRRARLRNLPSEVYTIGQLIERDGNLCVLCGDELDLGAKWPNRSAPTVEHLECLSWPGSAGDVLANVAVSHFGCNAERNIRPHPAAARKRAELIRPAEE